MVCVRDLMIIPLSGNILDEEGLQKSAFCSLTQIVSLISFADVDSTLYLGTICSCEET